MILDNDDDLDKVCAGGQAEGVSGEVDTGRIGLDASLHKSSPTSVTMLNPNLDIVRRFPRSSKYRIGG